MFRILVRTIGIRFSILGQVNDGAKLARTLSLPMNHEIQWWIFDMELSTVFSLGIGRNITNAEGVKVSESEREN